MHLIRELGRVRRMGKYISILPVSYDTGGPVEYGCDGGDTACHGLNDHQGTRIVVCGKHKDITVCIKLVNRFNPSHEDESILETKMLYKFYKRTIWLPAGNKNLKIVISGSL